MQFIYSLIKNMSVNQGWFKVLLGTVWNWNLGAVLMCSPELKMQIQHCRNCIKNVFDAMSDI
jgi:hypothetical protein